jgi:hypothetical protein
MSASDPKTDMAAVSAITIANGFLTIFLSDKFALFSPYQPRGDLLIVTAWLRAKFVDKSDEADASNALLSDIAKNSEDSLASGERPRKKEKRLLH